MEHSILVPELCPPQGTLGEAIASWLEPMSWDYWWTVTCKRPRRDEIAFIRDLTERQRHLGADGSFIACEPHKLYHNLHAHGLFRVARLTGDGHGLPVTSTEVWHEFFYCFGRSRVELIKSKRDVTTYLTKYVTKLATGDNWALWLLDNPARREGDHEPGMAYCERSPAPLPYNWVTPEDYNEFDRLLTERYQRPLFPRSMPSTESVDDPLRQTETDLPA